jgi:ferredoxin hydrogenase large subunit
MCAVSRYLKTIRKGCVTVFIGPCIAKKSESQDKSVKDNADYVITYGELRALMRSKDIKFEPVDDDYQESSIWGKRFAGSGGVANAVIEVMQERSEDTADIKLHKAAGGLECKKALALLKAGKLSEDFIEGMVCPAGVWEDPQDIRISAI